MAPLGVYANNIFQMVSVFQNEITAIVIGILLHISTTILFESSDGHKFNTKKIIIIILGT